MDSDNNWPAVVVKLWNFQKKWEHLSRIMVREVEKDVHESTSPSILLDTPYFLVLEKKVFIYSFYFFEFTGTLLYYLLYTIYI